MNDYSLSFEQAVDCTLKSEGFFSDHAWDLKTKYGITEPIAKFYGYDVEMLTIDQAITIYHDEFWVKLSLDAIANASWRTATEIFDTAVNTSGKRAVLIAQEALKLVFDKDIKVDGRMGPVTRGMLISVSGKYEKQLVGALNGGQYAYYIWLKRRGHRAAPHAIKGWMLRLTTPEIEISQ